MIMNGEVSCGAISTEIGAGGNTGFFRISVSVCHQLPCTGDKWDNPGDNVIVKVYRWFP
jgi:hypothetical protein